MDDKLIKHCKVCGREYEACVSCEKINSWRVHTDTAEHYYILCVLMEYQNNHDAKQAYDALCKYGIDFNKTDGYVPSVQKLLNEISVASGMCEIASKEDSTQEWDSDETNDTDIEYKSEADE